MKLKNKKTGKIIKLDIHCIGGKVYESLSEINAEWEDYEEPKEYWYIYGNQVLNNKCDGVLEDRFKEVGNYFSSREEAEKAVEKLKAWKRLKEARFRFTDFGYNLDETSSNLISADGKICFDLMCYEDFADDLELLFGGEE